MAFLPKSLERQRNEDGQRAFCGAILEVTGRENVSMDGDGAIVVVACSACAARIRKRRPLFWIAGIAAIITGLLTLYFRR